METDKKNVMKKKKSNFKIINLFKDLKINVRNG